MVGDEALKLKLVSLMDQGFPQYIYVSKLVEVPLFGFFFPHVLKSQNLNFKLLQVQDFWA